jgi:hypothetical protein
MKKQLIFLLLVCFPAFSQLKPVVVDEQVRHEMSIDRDTYHSRSDRHSVAGITTSYTGFRLEGISRQGLGIDLFYRPFRKISPLVQLNVGLIMYGNNSSQEPERTATDPFIYQNRIYTAPSIRNGRMDTYIGLAYLGVDGVYYFSQGPIAPYVGLGLKEVLWGVNNSFVGTLVPSAVAGVELSIASSFDGFVEARYMPRVANVVNSHGNAFGYVTSVAFGVSYAPQW